MVYIINFPLKNCSHGKTFFPRKCSTFLNPQKIFPIKKKSFQRTTSLFPQNTKILSSSHHKSFFWRHFLLKYDREINMDVVEPFHLEQSL